MVANFGVVGDGDIASVLPIDSDKLFFAAGVSNSRETRESEYLREIHLLFRQPQESHIVYFSTLAIFYSDTRYTQHKLRMEAIIKRKFDRYCIIRIGNIDFGQNPHTLINFLKAHPTAKLQDVYRYIVSKEELLYWLNLIPDFSCEMNVPGERLKVKEIYERYVQLHSQKI